MSADPAASPQLAELLRSRPVTRTRVFCTLGHRFAMQTTAPELTAYLDDAFGGMPSSDEPPATVFTLVAAGLGVPGYVFRDGAFIAKSPEEQAVMAWLIWGINQMVIHETKGRLLLHAAGAALDGACAVLAAPMESGKTTMVAGLLQRGLDYVTDEAVAIHPRTWDIDPYPKPLGIDRGSFEVLADLAPEESGALIGSLSSQWLVPPSRTGARVSPRCRPSLLVFPAYAPDAETGLVPVTPSEAVRLLAASTFLFRRQAVAVLPVLASLAERLPAFALPFADLEGACDAVIQRLTECEPAAGVSED